MARARTCHGRPTTHIGPKIEYDLLNHGTQVSGKNRVPTSISGAAISDFKCDTSGGGGGGGGGVSYIYSRGKRPYYAHLTGKRILWPNYWLHGDQTLAGYRLDNCLSIPKYKSVLSLQQFRQYRFSGGSAFVRNREQMPQ